MRPLTNRNKKNKKNVTFIPIADSVVKGAPLSKRHVCCVLSSHLFWTSVFWTHQPGSNRTKITQDSSTFLLRCLPLFFSREGFSRCFLSSIVKSNFVYPRIKHSPVAGHDARKKSSSFTQFARNRIIPEQSCSVLVH